MSTSNQQPEAAPAHKPTPSFYQRQLPAETCVGFSSRQGKRIFASALQHGGVKSFFDLIQQFHTQSEPAFCGLATLVLVLNAFAIDPEQNWKGPWRWYEESMLNCCVDLEEVKQSGITMKDFRCLAFCQGLSVETRYCDEASLEDFRAAIQKSCMSKDDGKEEETSLQDALVVSYSRKVIKQTGSGHFAALAAFDPVSDSVLILDTARFKYGSHWVHVPLLYDAMNTLDPDTGRKRGFFLLSVNHSSAETLNVRSIMFRSKMSQNPARRLYKAYLHSLSDEISWQQLIDFWGDEADAIWRIVEPLRFPKDETARNRIREVRNLISGLLASVDDSPTSCCDASAKGPTSISGSRCVSAKEALYLVYLASLGEERRRDIVYGATSAAGTEIGDELLNEAALISKAIFFSDEGSF